MLNDYEYEVIFYSVTNRSDIFLTPGVGTLTWPDGVVYEGDFNGGNLIGKGTYRWPDGSTYTGGILNGKREGDGKFECSGGQLYEGQWKNGKL